MPFSLKGLSIYSRFDLGLLSFSVFWLLHDLEVAKKKREESVFMWSCFIVR